MLLGDRNILTGPPGEETFEKGASIADMPSEVADEAPLQTETPLMRRPRRDRSGRSALL